MYKNKYGQKIKEVIWKQQHRRFTVFKERLRSDKHATIIQQILLQIKTDGRHGTKAT